MTSPPQPEPTDRSSSDPRPGSQEERVEALLVECLEAADPATAVAQAAAREPELAEQLRQAFAEMLRFDLVGQAPSSDGEMPERLGDYQLLERLGAGGMGVVYLARDDALQRTVALKLIRPEHMFLPGSRERFQREVETIARLQHPGIVPIYGVDKRDGVPFFTMQHVPGCSMARALFELQRLGTPPDGSALLTLVERATTGEGAERGSSDGDSGSHSRGIDELGWPDACVRITAQVASALHHAHERGVLHRDVKPSNILLTHGARALLVDFGLAWSDGDQRLTHSSSQLGSLPYLPPEQLDGRATDPSRSGDIYSLGVTLYEMLTLRNPFLGKNGEETRRNILGARALKLRREQRGISWELETVCLKAMDSDPAKRYRTMLEFGRDLERVLARESISARRPSAARRASRWAQRHPTVIVAASVALIAATVALSVFVVQERQARVVADRLRERAEVERYGALVSNADLELRAGRRPDRARRLLAECRPQDRGFEWRHLEYATDESAAVNSSFGGPLQAIAWLPDGSGYVASSQDHWLRLCEADHTERWSIEGRVSAVAVVPHGQGFAVVAAPLDGGLVLRALEDGAVLQTIERGEGAPTGELAGLVIAPDGERAYSVCSDGSLSTWDLAAGRFVETFGKHDRLGHRIAINPSGTRIASGGFDRTVRVFDVSGGDGRTAEVGVWEIAGWCLGLAFLDDRHLVFSDSHELLCADTDAPERAPVNLDENAHVVVAVAVDPERRTFACTVSRRLLQLYRFTTDTDGGSPELQPVSRMVGHEGIVQQLGFSPDGTTLLSGSSDQTVRTWRLDRGAVMTAKVHRNVVPALLWLTGGRLVSGDTRGNLSVGDGLGRATALEVTPGQPPHDDAIVALLPLTARSDALADRFLSIDADGRTIVWEPDRDAPERLTALSVTETGHEVSAATGHIVAPPSGPKTAPMVRPVFARPDGTIDASAAEGPTWQAHDARITALQIVGDELWSACVDGALRCWNLRTGELLREAPRHPSWISALAAAPDGSWIASSCADTALRVIDPRTGAVQRRLDGHGRVPLALCCDGDGNRLLSCGGFDGELRFWQPLDGRCLLRMPCPQMGMSLAFAPGEQPAIAYGGRDGDVVRLHTRRGGPRPFDERSIPMDSITSAPGEDARVPGTDDHRRRR